MWKSATKPKSLDKTGHINFREDPSLCDPRVALKWSIGPPDVLAQDGEEGPQACTEVLEQANHPSSGKEALKSRPSIPGGEPRDTIVAVVLCHPVLLKLLISQGCLLLLTVSQSVTRGAQRQQLWARKEEGEQTSSGRIYFFLDEV